MPKTFYLLRHADPEPRGNVQDHDRHITKRGSQEAMAIARLMQENQWLPEVVQCSTANRTRDTLAQVLHAWDRKDIPVQYHKTLYLPSAGQLLEHLRQFDDQYTRAMIVAHNPGVTQACRFLAGMSTPEAEDALIMGFPTAGLACFTFPEESWQAINPGSGFLECLIGPGTTL